MIANQDHSPAQTVQGDHAVGVQIDGDSNSVTIFAGGSKLVLDQPHKRRGAGAPANERQLLLTEWRATALVGRDDELAELAAWRDSPAPVAVRCIIGRAGSGKTRLAIEACERAEAAGWVAGFVAGDELRRFHAAQNLAQWRSPEETLIVVDDAAVSAAILKEWFGALARRPARPDERRLRILLLERHADADSDYGWWAELRRSDSLARAGAGDLIGAHRPVPLPPIAQGEERRALLAEAMRLAGSFLGKTVPSPPPPGADAEFDRRLDDDRFENEPLFLLMAGIAAVDCGAPAALALGGAELAREVAALERARLARLGASQSLPPDGDLIAHLAACATLQRGCDLPAARKLVTEEMAAMGHASPLSADRLVDLLAEALPTPDGTAIDRVRPDLIGEAFLLREVRGPRARSEAESVAIVERARRRNEAGTLDTLVLTAQDFAAGASDHPAVHWLGELANRTTNPVELARLGDAIPFDTLALRDLGASITERLAHLVRASRGRDKAAWLQKVLISLGNRLSHLGQYEAALAATEEAVGLCRILAAADPKRFNRGLASSLNNLAIYLGEIGRYEPALAAAEESVALCRVVTETKPDQFAADLARSLTNLNIALSQLGRLEAALAAAQESADLRRRLAAARPEIFNPDLAAALLNLAPRMAAAGQQDEAVITAREAVALTRTLAASRPDGFNPDLVRALSNLASLLDDIGRSEEALATMQEAIELSRALAAVRPELFRSELADYLGNLAALLYSLNLREPGRAAAEEAVALYRPLAEQKPNMFAVRLARALLNFAHALAGLGQHAKALAAGREAAELYRPHAGRTPDIDENLARALTGVGLALCDLGESGAALEPLQQAVEVRRRLAAARPEAHGQVLGASLMMLADWLEAAGRPKEAVAADRDALEAMAPAFMAAPATIGRMVQAAGVRYLKRAEAAGIEQDVELLAPIVAKLKEGRTDAD